MRRQIVLVTVAATAMVALAFVFPLAVLVRRLASGRAVDEANSSAQLLVSEVAAATTDDLLSDAVTRANVDERDRISVILPDGRVIGSSNAPVSSDSLELARRGQAFTRSITDGVEVLVPVVSANGDALVIRVEVPETVLHSGVYRVWGVLSVLGIGVVVAAGLLADRTARSITRPLNNASEAALRLAEGDLSARATESGTSEVRAVSAALNKLAERIDVLLQDEREALADLSHGLRTPLTALRLESEQLDDPNDVVSMTAAVDRVEQALTQLIHRTRHPVREAATSDLARAARERMAFWSILAKTQDRGLTINVAAESLPVRASYADVVSAIDALVGNVFEHTPAGVGLAVSTFVNSSSVQLVVDDEGQGFTLDRDMKRGARGAQSRGTGLGLDIARRVAEQSGGTLRCGNNSRGGARVVVEFGAPISAVSAHS